MKNQVDAIRSLSTESGIAHVLNSSLTKQRSLKLKGYYFWINKLLYVARVFDKEENVNFLKT
jgi:ATP-dependent DNA helicase RecQ